MKNLMMIFALFFSSQLLASPLPVEKKVDVSRYVGKWYAHYSLPQFFTRKCKAQTAEYEVINEKTISVLNTCLKKKGVKTITGQAVVTNPDDNSKLIVTFNNFFTRLFRVKGDYQIIKLDSNYEYVLIGSENRKSLWIMSRSPAELPKGIEAEYINLAKDLGFETKKLVRSRF